VAEAMLQQDRRACMDLSTKMKAERYLFEKGVLHDCVVERISWHPQSGQVEIAILDVNAGFLDLPEYPGREPVCMVLGGVTSVQMDLTLLSDRRLIYEASVTGDGDDVSLYIAFWPSGSMSAKFAELSFG
jgi:hypothetical protein